MLYTLIYSAGNSKPPHSTKPQGHPTNAKEPSASGKPSTYHTAKHSPQIKKTKNITKCQKTTANSNKQKSWALSEHSQTTTKHPKDGEKHKKLKRLKKHKSLN